MFLDGRFELQAVHLFLLFAQCDIIFCWMCFLCARPRAGTRFSNGTQVILACSKCNPKGLWTFSVIQVMGRVRVRQFQWGPNPNQARMVHLKGKTPGHKLSNFAVQCGEERSDLNTGKIRRPVHQRMARRGRASSAGGGERLQRTTKSASWTKRTPDHCWINVEKE